MRYTIDVEDEPAEMITQSSADKFSRRQGRRHRDEPKPRCIPEKWEGLTIWIDQWLSPEQQKLRKQVGAVILRPCTGISMAYYEEQSERPDPSATKSKKPNFHSLTIPESQESLIAALSPCIKNSDSEESDFDEHEESRLSQTASEEDDVNQLRRLGSWDTNGTFGTIGTNYSSSTLSRNGLDTNLSPVFDDDGNPIDPKLLQKTILTSQKRHSKRKRLVKFDYPPVSSMKECPRVDDEDMSKVFFAEGELEQFEEDRISTNVADDIEIVAVASSASDTDMPLPQEPETPQEKTTSNYVPTPRRRTAAHEANSAFDHAKRTKGKSMNRRHHAANSDSTDQKSKNDGSYRKEKRLIKSVQIYLRERSSGTSNHAR